MTAASLLLSLLLTLTVTAFSAEPARWQEAISLFKAEKYAEACTAFERLREETAQTNQSSLALFQNLSLCYSKLERWDKVVSSLAGGMELTYSPVTRWRWWNEIDRVQDRIGLKDSVSNDWNARILFLTPRRLVGALATLLLWGLVFPFLFPARSAERWVFAGTTLGMLVVCGGLLLQARLSGSPSVLISEDKEVSIYSRPAAEEEARLVQLPRGALVMAHRDQGDFSHIEAPIAGWVKRENLARLK